MLPARLQTWRVVSRVPACNTVFLGIVDESGNQTGGAATAIFFASVRYRSSFS